jgi:hypothetical protein
MALRAAIASGNWSNPAIWNGGVLPAPGDVVASNGFTVTIDQNINVDSLTNAVTTITNVIPTMTSNTTPSGIASASNVYASSPSYEPWRAFINANTGNPYLSGNLTFWLAYEFTSPKIIDRYEIAMGIGISTSSTMRDWTFEGWNGTSWVVLHTVTNYLPASWSSGYASPASIGNTTAYIKYRYNCTAANAGAPYVNVAFVRWYEYLSTAAVAGGGFTFSTAINITLTGTSGVVCGTGNTLTFTGGSGVVANLNASLTASTTSTGVVLTHSGAGTLNISCATFTAGSGGGRQTVVFSGSGVLNYTGGQIIGNFAAIAVTLSGSGTTNIIANIVGGDNVATLSISNGTLNITGSVSGPIFNNFGRGIDISGATTIVNITGNVISSTRSNAMQIGAGPSIINITGSVISSITSATGNATISTGSTCRLVIIGSIIADSTIAVSSTGSGAINIFTGPFVSGASGILPIYVTRMNYFRTLGSYYEFRDSSTNGALPPAASAPAIRMNSPEVGSDLPAIANVRFGTVYGVGSFTGTMRVPAASNVRLGVAVDTTIGTGAITAQDVWNVLTSGMNTSGSIGARLKNASTVDTTGNQLAAYL